jgi:pimeloyl-ACP methyl ester carboxylesterase
MMVGTRAAFGNRAEATSVPFAFSRPLETMNPDQIPADESPADYLAPPDATASRIAYRRLAGKSPGVVFCPGFKSDMKGAKATAVAAWATRNARACLRFDYRGHGESDGAFADGTIGAWFADTLAAFDALTSGPQIVVGSSMGGWMALLLARARPARVAAVVGIAAAPDFTEDLMWDRMPPDMQAKLRHDGVIYQPSAYGQDPYEIHFRLIEEGRNHLLLRAPLAYAGRVRLLQGMQDTDVPWQWSTKIAQALIAADVRVTLVKDGDHRLSRDSDILLLAQTLDELGA